MQNDFRKACREFLQGMIALNTTVLAVALYSSATTKAQAPIPVVVLFVVFLVLLFLSMRTEMLKHNLI